MSDLAALLEVLGHRARRGMVLGLDRMREALAALGDPDAGLPVVHVGGTNGKGSTCAMIEAITREAGLRTGLYTSPHLVRFAERIRVDGAPIDDAPFERALSAALERPAAQLTFFEALTAAAFVAFREAGVDLAILEVGLGGRLDATNFVEAPLCTAITSIALDHVETLGPTLDVIAREKAGILKRGAPVVLGPLHPDAEAAIREVAAAAGAGPIVRVVRAGDDPTGGAPDEIRVARRPGGARVRLPGFGADGVVRRPGAPNVEPGAAAWIDADLGLSGAHQADNAAVACGVAWHLAARWPAIAAALPAGLAAARWPGRLERIEVGQVTVVLDCAHNAEGARALAAALDEGGPGPDRTALVFGALADKAFAEMLGALAPRAGRRFYVTPKGRAAAPLEALCQIAPGLALGNPETAVRHALNTAAPGDHVVVAGSLYLAGEIRAVLLGIRPDPIVAL